MPVQRQTRLFYRGDQLQLALSELDSRTLVGITGMSLAEVRASGSESETALLGFDSLGSIGHAYSRHQSHVFAYTSFGHTTDGDARVLLGFAGQRRDAALGCYQLGNGYRSYSPVLMRFHSPDSWSPFARGGINAYAYCKGDPINTMDPSGHGRIGRFFGLSNSPQKDYKALAIKATEAHSATQEHNGWWDNPSAKRKDFKKASKLPENIEGAASARSNFEREQTGKLDIDGELRLVGIENLEMANTKMLERLKQLKSTVPARQPVVIEPLPTLATLTRKSS
ncbi:RHS repeat-associated core domain protein-containing protein [Pseudomonas reidholzensis]|uniref:RHS repeat-associated core domain protein-containing protein n=1 Tax=Pseudomonas reidholzensis TaxID=1785162 RepID=A0A383RTT2_9PSED|nr:RHS repeat-associated core domain-containing protein [Pseudomonas reidholzensis]SYX89778.1 RHS repeat-associated core domain protein-containing protein [Pseudomonas reidholzensis]